MGMRITKLEPYQGFAAEMAAATTITIASRLGIPLSTTHTISTAIVGVGAARGASAVRWGVTVELVVRLDPHVPDLRNHQLARRQDRPDVLLEAHPFDAAARKSGT